jgi:drug/metabolite transporter (DMT)-like permease
MTPASRALWLGVAAMAMFGMTLPMTQLATGTAAAPHFSPLFVTCARAVVAAGLSALWLWRVDFSARSQRPAASAPQHAPPGPRRRNGACWQWRLPAMRWPTR